jgi:hypothetical protein
MEDSEVPHSAGKAIQAMLVHLEFPEVIESMVNISMAATAVKVLRVQAKEARIVDLFLDILVRLAIKSSHKTMFEGGVVEYINESLQECIGDWEQKDPKRKEYLIKVFELAGNMSDNVDNLDAIMTSGLAKNIITICN